MGKTKGAVPSTLTTYLVDSATLAETARELRRLSDGRREAVALWAGDVVSASTARVTRIVFPRQVASRLHFDVPLDERLRLVGDLAERGEVILVQLHTHPAEAFHSLVDDRLAIPRHTGAISVVIPQFAGLWSGDLAECSVNRHVGAGRWEELGEEDARRMFLVGQS